MRFPGLIFALALCFGVPMRVGAQDIDTVLRAGEHRDFTRLVMALPDGTEWRLQNGTDHVDLIFKGSDLRVDLSQTFERIPRTRLRAVEPLENGIRMFLNCPCRVEPVNGIIGQAVLDIRSSEDAFPAPNPGIRPPARPGSPPINSVAQQAGVRLARILRGQPDTRPTDKFALENRFAPIPTPRPPDTPRGATSPMVATEVTDTLLSAISGAVSNDLLTADTQFTPPPEGPQISLSDDAARHVLTQRSRGAEPEELPEQTCTNAISDFISTWPAELDMQSGSGNWSSLYDPLDRVDQAAATRLLQRLLGNGLGTEARSVLSLMPETRHTAPIRSLTYLLDLEPPPDPDELLNYAACSDLDALWAFLSSPSRSLALPNMENRIVRAAQALSPHLRAHLGPAIIHRLLRHGAPNGASLVQSVLDRSYPETDANRTTPELLLAQPGAIAALERPDMLALADEDLLLVLENAQTHARTLPADFLSIVIDRQFALRRSALGRSFAQLTARALATAGEFDAAFRMANDGETGLDDRERTVLLAALFNALSQTAPDTTFVTTVFSQEPWQNAALSQKTRTELGLRLAELGFADAASRLQPPRPEPRDTAQATSPPMPGANGSTTFSPAPPMSDAAESTGRGTANVAVLQDPSASASANPVDLAQPPDPADIGPRVAAQPNSRQASQGDAQGLLAQGRRSLESSEALRARLDALLGDSPDAQGLTQ